MQWRNLGFTKISDVVTNLLLHHSLYLVVDGQCRIVQMVNGVSLKKKKCLWMCVTNLQVFVQTIFMFENPFEQLHVPFLSFTRRKVWTSVSVKKFLLCFAWNWHLPQIIYKALTVSRFDFFCREVWQF